LAWRLAAQYFFIRKLTALRAAADHADDFFRAGAAALVALGAL
jgi:hypothetical protein